MPEAPEDTASLRNEDLADHPGPGRDYPDVCDFLHRAFAAGWGEETEDRFAPRQKKLDLRPGT